MGDISPHIMSLLQQYGYWLMAFGAIIEGETFLIAGGIAAHQGLFKVEGLILLALVGSTAHDCFFFFLGRFFGKSLVKKRPQLYAKSEGILNLFEKYGVLMIIGLRYAYGLRTIIPTVLGMSHLSTRKFIFYDIIGGILWSCTFVLSGYLFGAAIDKFLHDLEIFAELPILLVAAGIIVAGFVFMISMRVLNRNKLPKFKKDRKNVSKSA